MSIDLEYNNLVKMHNLVQDQIKDLKKKSDAIKESLSIYIMKINTRRPYMSIDLEYSSLVKMYNLVQDQTKDLKEKSDEIKESLAKLMHIDQINEKIVSVEGINFHLCYQSRTSKKVDYDHLMQIVGPHKYNEIVTNSQSTFLSIRKAAKGKQDDLIHTAPNGKKKTLTPPIGTLA